MTSLLHSPPVSAPRWTTPRRADRATIGPQVAAVARALGFDLMPWQRHVHDVAGQYGPDGFDARTVVVIVGRQSGKTTGIALPRIMWALLETPGAVVVYTAQDRASAYRKWTEHVNLLTATPLARVIRQVYRRSGAECVILRNGSRYQIVTPDSKGSRGLTGVRLAVVDEGMTHTDMRAIGAIQPTMATVPFAQLLVLSNAGDDRSAMLAHYRDLGRDGGDLAYFEWAPAVDDPDPTDPNVWREAIPSLGLPGGVTFAAVREAQATVDPRTFAQEWLNVWQTGVASPLIDPETFDGLADVDVELGTVRPVVAYDVSPDRMHAAVAAATRDGDGIVTVTITAARPGTTWLPEVIAGLEPDRVLADTVAGDLAAAQLVEQGIDVELVGGLDVARACATFVDVIAAHRLRHHAQPALTDAIAGAVTRPFGDAWAWSRRLSPVDVTPLVAASLATWGTFDLAGLNPAVH